MYTIHDIYITNTRREARALRMHLDEYNDKSIVAFRSHGEWWCRTSDSNVPFEPDYLCQHSHTEVVLHPVVVAWPGDAIDPGSLPNGSIIWFSGERRMKQGGTWYGFADRSFYAISEEIARACLPRTWMK